MSLIKLLPLPNDISFNKNNMIISGFSGNDSFRNGSYIVRTSSFKDDSTQPYNIFNNDNSIWSSGAKGSSKNLDGQTYNYKTNPYNDAVPSSFIGGENSSDSLTYWGTVANNIQDKKNIIYGEWIQIQLPYPIYLSKYKIASITKEGLDKYGFTSQGITNELYMKPYKYALLSSNDGENWNLLDSVTNPTTDTYTIHNVIKSSYYRIIISQLNGGAKTKLPVAFTGLELYGADNIINSTNPIESFNNVSSYSNQISSPQYINTMSCGSCGIKAYSKSDVISTNRILENFQIKREPYTPLTGNVDLNSEIIYQQGNAFITKRDELLNNPFYDYSGNVLFKNNGIPNMKEAILEDATEYTEVERNVFILGTISVAIVVVGFIIVSSSE